MLELTEPKLKKFQVQPSAELVLKATQSPITIDASDPGIGKTFHAAFLIYKLLQAGLIKHVAIVCPASVRVQWRIVLEKHGMRALIVDSYEKLSQGRTAWFSRSDQTNDGRPVWHLDGDKLLIFDEAHKLKGQNSAMSKLAIAARHALKRGIRVHLMSGTLGVTPLDFYAIGFLMRWHNLIDFYKWCRARGCKDGMFGLEYNPKETGINGMQMIHEALAPVMIRVRKKDIPDFPQKIFEVVLLDDEGDLVQDAIERVIDSTAQKRGKKNDILGIAAKMRSAIELAKVPLCMDTLLTDLLAGYSVVWSFNYDPSMDYAVNFLRKSKIPFSVIRGGQSDAIRHAEVQRFQSNEVSVILVNTQAGGTGINLQDETGEHPRMTLVNLTHRVIDLQQFMDRTHRATSRTPSTVKILLVNMGPEKRMHSAIKKKVDNISTLNDGEIQKPLSDYIEIALTRDADAHTEFSLGAEIPLPFKF